MSSRYGRNKRRRHREEMASLFDKYVGAGKTIEKLVTGGDWRMADDSFQPLSDLVTGVGRFDIVEHHSARRIEKIATLEVFFDDRKLRDFQEMLMQRGARDSRITVEWHGGVWWLDILNVEMQHDSFGRRVVYTESAYEMKLHAVPNPDSKQQVFNSDLRHVHRASSVWGNEFYDMDPRSMERIAL